MNGRKADCGIQYKITVPFNILIIFFKRQNVLALLLVAQQASKYQTLRIFVG